MKKFLLATVALVALGATVPALAADLGARASPLHQGSGLCRADLQLDRLLHRRSRRRRFRRQRQFQRLGTGNNGNSRFLGGVQAGADYQFAPNWVVGVEGQYSWLAATTAAPRFPAAYSSTTTTSAGSARSPAASATPGVRACSTSRAAMPTPTTTTVSDARRRAGRVRAQQQPSRRLHRRRRPGIHVRPELVGQARISVLQLRPQPTSLTPAALIPFGSFRTDEQYREGRHQLSLQLGWPGGRPVLIRRSRSQLLGKAGLAPAFLFSGVKIARNPRKFPDFVNPVTRYCRRQFILQGCKRARGSSMAVRSTIGKSGLPWLFAAAMGRPGQPVCRLCRDRGHGHRHQRRRRHGAGTSRRHHDRSERTGHSPSCRQPAIGGPEREPCQPGTGAAGVPQAKQTLNERSAKMKETQEVTLREARRDHRARRRQGGGRRAQRNRQEHRRHHQGASAPRPASGSRPRPSTRSNTMRCARRRRASSPPPAPR